MEEHNMVKTVKYLISVALSIATAASCSFLEEESPARYSGKDIYGTEAALETAITGCYAQLRTSTGLTSTTMHEFLFPASGVVHFGGPKSRLSDGQLRWTMLLSFAQYSTSPQGYNLFKNFYATIQLCNRLIYELPASPVDQHFKDQIEGEARFLRAVSYFYLVRQWGNVPIHLEPAQTLSDANGKRVDFWLVYDQIIDDLKWAEANVRTYDEQFAINAKSSGRICNYAATAMLSTVYVTIGSLLAHPDDNFWVGVTPDFSKHGIETAEKAYKAAKDAALAVLDETKSPFRLEENYADLFRWTDLTDFESRERIFVIPNTSEVDGSTLAGASLPAYINGTALFQNYGRIRPTRWYFQKWCETYGGTLGSGNAANIFVKCDDPRLDAALIYNKYVSNQASPLNCYPNAASIYINSNEYKQCMPYWKKYLDPRYDATNGYADLYVMRLAEVYLNAAEACAYLGDKGAAVGYVNELLKRARGGSSAQPEDLDAADFNTNEELITRIFWERCFELGGEGHEYYDTHRFGATWLSENIAKPHNAFLYLPEQDDFSASGKTVDGYRTTHFGQPKYGEHQIYPETVSDVRKGLICAFPRDELTYNTALSPSDQNPSEVFWQ